MLLPQTDCKLALVKTVFDFPDKIQGSRAE